MRHIAENGFGTPLIMPVMYGLKIVLYVLGAWLFAWSTKGIGDFTNVAAWWTEPIVFQKAVLTRCCSKSWSRLLLRTAGRALFPADRFTPLLVATRHRPAATLAPPGAADQGQQQDSVRRVALRPPPRVALDRAGVRRQRANPALHSVIGVLPRWQTIAILAVLAALGLRDKVIFLATRGEVYAPLALVFLCSGRT